MIWSSHLGTQEDSGEGLMLVRSANDPPSAVVQMTALFIRLGGLTLNKKR